MAMRGEPRLSALDLSVIEYAGRAQSICKRFEPDVDRETSMMALVREFAQKVHTEGLVSRGNAFDTEMIAALTREIEVLTLGRASAKNAAARLRGWLDDVAHRWSKREDVPAEEVRDTIGDVLGMLDPTEYEETR